MFVLVFRPKKLRLPLLGPKVSTPPNELAEVDRSIPLPLPTVKVASPVVVMAPLCVMLPAAVTFSVVALLVPKTKSLLSSSVTTLPLVILTVPKSLPEAASVMLLVPAPSVVAPATTMLPVWVMLPPLVMAVRLPDRVMAERSMSVLVFRPKKLRLPLLGPKVSTPPNELIEVDRSMPLPLPTVKVALPVVVMAPLWVMLPAAVTFSVVALLVPKMMSLVSFSVATLALVMLTVPKLLPASDSVMLSVPALSVVVPGTTRAPVWVMSPPLVMAVKLPVRVTAAKAMAELVFRPRSSRVPPKVRLPPNEFVCVDRSIDLPVLAVKEALPATEIGPVWLMFTALPPLTKSVPERLVVPKTVEPELVRARFRAVRLITPLMALPPWFCDVIVTSKPVALMFRAFVTMTLLLVAVILPPVTKFNVDALSMRSMFKALTSVNEATFAFRSRSVPKSLAGSFRVMLFEMKRLVPGSVSTPVCVTSPLVIKAIRPESVVVPRIMEFLSVISANLPLLMFTVPKSLFPLLRVMSAPAPALSVVVPLTTRAPLLPVMAPAEAILRVGVVILAAISTEAALMVAEVVVVSGP